MSYFYMFKCLYILFISILHCEQHFSWHNNKNFNRCINGIYRSLEGPWTGPVFFVWVHDVHLTHLDMDAELASGKFHNINEQNIS